MISPLATTLLNVAVGIVAGLAALVAYRRFEDTTVSVAILAAAGLSLAWQQWRRRKPPHSN